VTLTITHSGLTDIGRVRGENQDRWFADPDQGLYLVADGMGGAFGGGLAAQIVVDTLPGLLRGRMRDVTELASDAAAEKLLKSLCELSNRLRAESRGEPGLDGMGSTVVLALARDCQMLVAHLGDSRAYLWRDGKLERLTKDHTIVQLLIDSGDIQPHEAETHPARGRLTRFVGMDGEPLPDARLVEVRAGDRLLLCSDGLTGMITDDELASFIDANTDPPVICQRLIDAANDAGGKDNVTAVLIRFGPGV
jgi:serine/threonine protein phosphatase PrpC